jgi:O-antigen ligase
MSTVARPLSASLEQVRASAPNLSLGFLYVLAVPLGAGLATIIGINIAGVAYTGLMWSFFLVAGAVLILAERDADSDNHIYFPLKFWCIWFGFLWLSLSWCKNMELRNIQDAVQISMPLLVGAAASLCVRTEEQLERLLRIFVPTLLFLMFWVAVEHLGILETLKLELADRSLALTASLAGCVLMSWFPGRIVGPLLGWACAVGLTVLTGSRMATLALLLVPALHPLYRSRLHNVLILGVSAVLGLALFYTPTFQERFFFRGSGTLEDVMQGDFLSFGRFETWPDIWEEACRQPFLGHGIGTAYNFVPTVWEDMHFCHNDYLRVGFELGLVGVCLFVGVLIWQTRDVWVHMKRSQGVLRTAFAASWLGLMVLMISSWTDNTLSYNLWYMNPLFAVMGAAYGVAGRAAKTQATECAQPAAAGAGEAC